MVNREPHWSSITLIGLQLVIVDTTAAPAMQSAALFLFANYYSRYRMC